MTTDRLGDPHPLGTVVPMFDHISPVKENPDGVTIVLQAGLTEKQIHVTKTSDLTINQCLESIGGRYVKKYDSYRFKKNDEARLRARLEKFVHEQTGDAIHIDDQIRSRVELVIGEKYQIRGNKWVLHSFVPDIPDRRLRIKFQKYSPQLDDYIQSFTTIDINNLASSYELIPVNAAAVLDKYINNFYRDSDSFLSKPDRNDFLSQNGVVHHEGREIYVALEPGPGSYATYIRGKNAEGSERFAAVPPSVWTSTEAVNVASGFLPGLEELSETQEASSDIIAKSDTQFRVLRGKFTTRIGRNEDRDDLYEGDDGLRFRVNRSGLVLAESPYVTPAGEMIVNSVRDQKFQTLLELSPRIAEGNVIPIVNGRITEEEATINPQSIDVQLEAMGIDRDLLFNALTLQVRIRSAEHVEENQFVVNRRTREAAEAQEALDIELANQGYEITPEAMNALADSMHEKYQDFSERFDTKVEAALIQYNVSQASTARLLEIRELSIETVREMPGHWLKECLDQCSHIGAWQSFSLLMAKAYGNEGEVSKAIEILAQQDSSEAQLYSDVLAEKYKQERARTELPSKIVHLTGAIQAYEGRSPIPKRQMQEQLSALYVDLANAQFDIEAIEVSDQDVEAYRVAGSQSELSASFSKRHNISVDAAKIYCSRVEKVAAERAHRKFLSSSEFIVGHRAAGLIQDLLIGDGRHVVIGDSYDSPSIEFPWGAGHLSVSRPEKRSNSDGSEYYSFSVHCSGSKSSRSSSDMLLKMYDELPSAEILARDTVAFAALHNTELHYWKAVEFCQKITDRSQSNTEVAKLIRSAIKSGIKDGVIPAGTKTSVRKRGGAIELSLREVPEGFKLYTEEYLAYNKQSRAEKNWKDPSRPSEIYTLEGAALINALSSYQGAWNYSDDYNPYSDYQASKYYGSVSVDQDILDTALEVDVVDTAELDERYASRYSSYPEEFRRMATTLLHEGSCELDNSNTWIGYRISNEGEYELVVRQSNRAEDISLEQAKASGHGRQFCPDTATLAVLDFLSDKIEKVIEIGNNRDQRKVAIDLIDEMSEQLSHRLRIVAEEVRRISRQFENIETAMFLGASEDNSESMIFGYKQIEEGDKRWFSISVEGELSRLSKGLSLSDLSPVFLHPQIPSVEQEQNTSLAMH